METPLRLMDYMSMTMGLGLGFGISIGAMVIYDYIFDHIEFKKKDKPKGIFGRKEIPVVRYIQDDFTEKDGKL